MSAHPERPTPDDAPDAGPNSAASAATDAPPPPPGDDGWIRAHGLTRRFGAHVAVHPTDLDVGPGQVTGLLGPNGSGKSTLMRMLTGLVRPDSGSATIDGVRLDGDGTAVRERLTYAPGELHLYGEMRGAAHLDWLLRGRSRDVRRRARAMAEDALALPLRQKVRGYSHGMKRQLLFAAAMAPDVRVRILDEATEGLDPTRRSAVLDLLAEEVARGTTVLLSSHHLGEVDRVCGRLIFLNAGRVVADESASGVADRAGRVVRLRWASAEDAARAQALLSADDARVLRSEGGQLTLELDSRDPRPFLARLGAANELPPPIAIEHGALSLQEFYREVYGVEGC